MSKPNAAKKARFDQNDLDANEVLLNPSADADDKQKFLKVGKLEQPLYEFDGPKIKKDKRADSDMRDNTLSHSLRQERPWKPAKNHSYETIVLTQTTLNEKLRPAGFRTNAKHRQIKNTSMISKIRTRCRIRKSNPALAVCITMYNEEVEELQTTLRGCLHNYNTLKADAKDKNFTKDDFLVVVIADGYDNIPKSFKALGREKGFLDEEVLFQKGFMELNRDKEFKMVNIRDVMDEGVDIDKVPSNILHCFQITTWDFGIEADYLRGRRINFMFCVKHRNDGKINSHKWFFQAVCKYLKPEYCLMLDIGTRPDDHAIQKLVNFMKSHPQAGGVCGEIEVAIDGEQSFSSFMVQAAQFYEYKLGHTPDKACESFFGFTQVLPGAYSVFRWKAIKGTPLDKFFKNVTRKETPKCAEANEYLAEDRIMCLQVYIKENTGYTVQYIPDAKAFTDGPLSLTVLMKQRRRWMNGALFGTYKVIANTGAMVSCGRNDHPCCRQILMILYMIYMITLYLLQFLTVGAMFVTIIIFYDQFFELLFVETNNSQIMKDIYDNGIVKKVLFSLYLGVIFLSTFVSISLPINRAMTYFRVVSIILGVLMLTSIFGITYFLAQRGLYPPVSECVPPADKPDSPCEWVDVSPPETYFSTLCLAGIIMLTIYVLPMVMRPLDFLSNFKHYICGFIGYMVMMPVFTNVFQIYAMCNLHDVSWGNRPASTGQEAFTDVKKEQAKSEEDYKVFRTNFVLIWLAANMGYYIMIVELVSSASGATYRDHDSGYLAGFSLYLGGLVVFRVLFASIYICKWKCRYNCSKKYKVPHRNMIADFKTIKKNCVNGESTDDEEMEEELNKIYEKNKEEIRRRAEESQMNETSAVHDQTLAFVNQKQQEQDDEKESDEDYDFKEFEPAGVEEAEDRIYTEYKRCQNEGTVMDEEVLKNLAGNVPIQDMNTSIITSARRGMFSQHQPLRQSSNQELDLSAMIANEQKLARKQQVMAAMFEQTAQNQNSGQRRGGGPNNRQMHEALAASGHRVGTTEDLGSSQRSTDIIQNAQGIIRKNSDQDALMRASKAGSVHPTSTSQFQAIAEEPSLEASRIQNSGDLENQHQSSNSAGGLQNIFEQTNQQQKRPAGSSGLAGLFEATAADQDKKQRKPY